MLPSAYGVVSALSYIFALEISILLVRKFTATAQQLQMMQSFSLLFLGATLSTWATINFSLALIVGLLASPLSFVRPASYFTAKNEKGEQQTWPMDVVMSVVSTLVWLLASPPLVIYALSYYLKQDLGWILLEIAKGWTAQGVWSNLVVWNVWWPAWVIAGAVLFSNVARKVGI